MPSTRGRGQFNRLVLILILVLLLAFFPFILQVIPDMEYARRAIATGSYGEAASYLASAAESQPWRMDLWELAGQYALQNNDPQAAIHYLEHARQAATTKSALTSLSPQFWILLGDAYEKTGNLDSASSAWQSAAAAGASEQEVLLRQLRVHRLQGEYAAAVADMQAMIELQPGDGSLHFQLGLLMAAFQPRAALEPLEQALKLDPTLAAPAKRMEQCIRAASLASDDAYLLVNSGRCLASLDEWDLAFQAFQLATQLRPDYAEAWAYLGEAQQHRSDLFANHPEASAGLAELTKALELNPKSEAAYTFLALYWLRQQKYEPALQAILSAASLDPDNPVLQAELGNILASSGKLNEAHQAYEQAISLAPKDPQYWRRLAAFSLNYSYQLDQVALPAARQAVNLAPQDTENLDLIAQVLIRLSDLVSAERFLARALQIDTNYVPAHLHLGLIYALQGNPQAALTEFNLVLSLAPESPMAEQARRLIEIYGIEPNQ